VTIRARRRSLRVALGPLVIASTATVAIVAGSCASQGEVQPFLQSLDRPTDVAFACSGRLRITDGQEPTGDQPVKIIPQPLDSCRTRAVLAPPEHLCPPGSPPSCVEVPAPGAEGAVDTPAGQGNLPGQASFNNTHSWYAFILQSVPGTVAIAQADVKKPGEGYLSNEIQVQDATPLTPGKNSLSVGSLPVAIATDAAGCHMVTANAGSCDLSIIDINRAIARSPEPTVRRQGIVTPGGVPVLARPAAMLSSEPDRLIGRECPADPDGLYYVAYPECHAVAVLRADTGEIQASIRFADDGTASIGDGELACPAECGGGAITAGARPVTLDLVEDTRVGNLRLAVGLDNRPVVTVVDLDSAWLPVGITQVELSGDVGLLDVAISPQIGVGGSGPTQDDEGPGTDQAQFVYGVATDGSVRVAEVFDNLIECDTQTDPRFLLDVADASQLTCIPVGLPGTPPRRAMADGPGIRIPGDAVPVSVTITRSGLGEMVQDVVPTKLIGTFAYVGLSSGVIAVVNVDDDNYGDLQLTAVDPLKTQLALAMPHQPRDSFANRVARAEDKDEMTGVTTPICKTNPILNPLIGGPRTQTAPTQVVRPTAVSALKSFELPFLRQLDCMGSDGRAPVSELSINAPLATRLETYPDGRGLELQVSWANPGAGTLSADSADTSIDGPALRSGYVEVAGGGIKVHDAARPFCAIGVEDRDSIVLRGCDPSRGDAQCGPGATCYVHPDSTQAAGACLPKEQVADLAGPCRDFLVSSRRFAIKRAFADNLELIERRRTLRSTPIDGCTSSAQCQQLADYEERLDDALQPVDDTTPASTRTFACELDPSRPPIDGVAINRCVQTCEASADCGSGGLCSGNRCIEAPVPPPQCVVGLQKYELQASDAFVVLGSVHGYLHGMVADPTTGRCVKDPEANPLLAGRIPLAAPPCAGSGVPDVSPNPCSIEVQHTEERPVFTGATCASEGTTIETRTVPAIRFRNPAMTMNLVDPTYPGDARCIGDRAGNLGDLPLVYPGYQIRFEQVAGFSTMAVNSVRAAYLSRLIRGPDNAVWAVDEGDISTSLLNARGAVFRFPTDPLGVGLVIR
jgi:hypothetical protein